MRMLGSPPTGPGAAAPVKDGAPRIEEAPPEVYDEPEVVVEAASRRSLRTAAFLGAGAALVLSLLVIFASRSGEPAATDGPGGAASEDCRPTGMLITRPC